MRPGPLHKGLVGWWPLSQSWKDGSGNYLDRSSSGNHGTPTGSPTAATDRMGQANRALSFDGDAQEIVVPHDASLNLTNFTVCGWVNLGEHSRYQSILSKEKYALAVGPDMKPVFSVRGSPDGTTWTEVEDTTESFILALAVFDGYLYAGSESSGKIYRSSDGTNWTMVEDVSEVGIISLAVFDGYLYAGSGNNGKIYRSSDGTNWTMVEDTTEGYIRTLGTFDGYIYAGTGGSGKIYRMGDGGDVYGSSAMSTSTWHHLAGTYDGSTMKLYLDGQQVGSKALAVSVGTNSLDLKIGSSLGSRGGGYSSTGEEKTCGSTIGPWTAMRSML